jgi:GNAT superfamily N-acetyltransferase
VTVRRADADDYRPLMAVLEGALLDVDPENVRRRIDAGEALVAVDDGRVVGGLVREGNEILAVAVVRRRRGEGLGRGLIDRAGAAAAEPLVATFDGRVRDVYESLGFDVEAAADGRYRGVRR